MTNTTQSAATGAPATNTTDTTDRQKALADIECTDVLAGHAFALRKLYDEITREPKEYLIADPNDEFCDEIAEGLYDPIAQFITVHAPQTPWHDDLAKSKLRSTSFKHDYLHFLLFVDIAEMNTRAKKVMTPITKHVDRLENYRRRLLDKILADGLSNEVKQKAERATVLVKCYERILSALDACANSLKIEYDSKFEDFNNRSRKLLGERLRQARKAKGLTMLDVAGTLRISRSAYNTYELGQRDLPTPTICRLAILFDTSLDWLFGLKD